MYIQRGFGYGASQSASAATTLVPMTGAGQYPTNATVAAAGATSRRDVNLILTLDRSSSMQSAGVCGIMANSAIAFVDKFTEGRDRLGSGALNGRARGGASGKPGCRNAL